MVRNLPNRQIHFSDLNYADLYPKEAIEAFIASVIVEERYLPNDDPSIEEAIPANSTVRKNEPYNKEEEVVILVRYHIKRTTRQSPRYIIKQDSPHYIIKQDSPRRINNENLPHRVMKRDSTHCIFRQDTHHVK